MALTIEIRGSATNDVEAAESVVLEALGMLPRFDTKSTEQRTYPTGDLRALASYRMVFDFVFNEFVVNPDGIWQDHRKYFQLMKLLQMKYVWIYEVGESYLRITDETNGLVVAGYLTFPRLVSPLEFPEPDPDFERGVVTLTGMKLQDINFYEF